MADEDQYLLQSVPALEFLPTFVYPQHLATEICPMTQTLTSNLSLNDVMPSFITYDEIE